MQELLHKLRAAAPKSIDRLVVIPHRKYISFISCQKAQHIILCFIDILELIHKKIPVPLLPHPEQSFMFVKDIAASGYHIIEIDQIRPFDKFIIRRTNHAKIALLAYA